MDEAGSRVLQNRKVSDSYFVLSLGVRAFPRVAPGQFIQILCHDDAGTTPFLRRPFSVMNVRGRTLDVFYKVIGPGTQRMSEWRRNDRVSILGPCGNTYTVAGPEIGPALVVAGGTGLGGVYFLIRELRSLGVPVVMLYGVRRRREVATDMIRRLGARVEVVVEETDGIVTKRLSRYPLERFTRCFVCGPTGMIRAAVDVVRKRIPMVEVSLEEMMGCGFGICYTCPVKRRDSPGYYRACDEGPVFREEMIAL